MVEYDYRVLYLPRGMTREAARRILTDHAEYGHWELARLRLYADGSRKATLRRRIIRLRRPALLAGLRLATPGPTVSARGDNSLEPPDAGLRPAGGG